MRQNNKFINKPSLSLSILEDTNINNNNSLETIITIMNRKATNMEMKMAIVKIIMVEVAIEEVGEAEVIKILQEEGSIIKNLQTCVNKEEVEEAFILHDKLIFTLTINEIILITHNETYSISF